MTQAIARLGSLLLRFLLPAAGRHRASDTGPLASSRAPAGDVRAASARRPARPPVLLSSADAGLVRPYVLTPEERQGRRMQRGRRRAPWLAVHGIDPESRWIPESRWLSGAEVTAR